MIASPLVEACSFDLKQSKLQLYILFNVGVS